MPARKPADPLSAVASGPSGTGVLAGVLRRMGDVLGPGAISSLVHYGALEEGLHIAIPSPGDAAAAVQAVAAILGVEARCDVARDTVRVHVKRAPHISMESRACSALVVGLLEGALTTARRHKVQAKGDPTLDADGTLHIDLAG